MELNYCVNCKSHKQLSSFYKDNRYRSGCRSECKTCTADRTRAFIKTKIGFIGNIYQRQRASSVRRGHDMPNYNCAELRSFALSQPLFHSLFSAWVASDYKYELTPSFDRINDYKPYTFDNIQIMTWKENREKSYLDKINGVNRKTFKKTTQITLKGAVICVYSSAKEASENTGVNASSISLCCHNKRKSAGGFVWSFI